MKLYCLRCKKPQEVGALKPVKIGKRYAYKAKCPKCGCSMFQFCASP